MASRDPTGDDAAGHISVLYQEAMHWLALRPGQAYIDATVGLGGHAQGILERSSSDGRLLAIDADPQALSIARRRLVAYAARIDFVQARHRDLLAVATAKGYTAVSGVLFDLGVSSLQLDEANRGFSFQRKGPLDMRMGPDVDLTAEEIVNTWPEQELSRIIYEYGEERYARRIASAVCRQRPVRNTLQLARIVSSAVPGRERIHPATRTFQALRIAVNDELGSLAAALPQAVELLKPGGRLVVISFHSLEDRIVKRFIQRESKDCLCPPRIPICVCSHIASVRSCTKKPIRPQGETAENPRSRSARMRVAEKLGDTGDSPATTE